MFTVVPAITVNPVLEEEEEDDTYEEGTQEFEKGFDPQLMSPPLLDVTSVCTQLTNTHTAPDPVKVGDKERPVSYLFNTSSISSPRSLQL